MPVILDIETAVPSKAISMPKVPVTENGGSLFPKNEIWVSIELRVRNEFNTKLRKSSLH